jgi:predicted GNAT family acetyltransferase
VIAPPPAAPYGEAMTAHPLDRPIWSALTTRQSALAIGDDRALRLAPEYGVFAAAKNASREARFGLVPLLPAEGELWAVEPDPVAPPPGMIALRHVLVDQMVAASIVPAATSFTIVPLTDDDAAEMYALATLTRPGPFFSHTHRLGAFVGVKQSGRLIAMAGERMKPDDFTEVSGVCTHPDHRGHGYAGGLMRVVAERIVARGETPFLHVYPDNRGAIALYETLGFALRRTLTLTILARA